MAFKYDKLWGLIGEKGISKSELREKIGASQTTIVSLGRNKSVSLDIIDRICNFLECQPGDVFEFIPDAEPETKLRYKRGEIYYVDFSGCTGALSLGVRPALIIQNDIMNKCGSTTILSPLTTNFDKAELPTHIELIADKKNNLPKDSLVMLKNLHTIDNRRLKGKLGRVSSEDMEKVEKALLIIFGIHLL